MLFVQRTKKKLTFPPLSLLCFFNLGAMWILLALLATVHNFKRHYQAALQVSGAADILVVCYGLLNLREYNIYRQASLTTELL